MSTALTTIVEQLPASLSPRFSPDLLTDEELLDFQIMTSNYTGGETIDARKVYSRSLSIDGEKVDKVVWIWGLFCYPKNRVDEITGEVRQNVGVVFLIGDENGPIDQYLSFESTAATRFVERSLLPLIQRNIIGVGDWQIGLPMQVWQVPLQQGHTYRFKLLPRKS